MLLYRSSISDETGAGALSHFGTLRAAADRLDGLFLGLNPHAYDSKTGNFIAIDYEMNPCDVRSPQQVVTLFADFVKAAHLQTFEVDIQNSLRLQDCWTEDPIGSGGLEILDPQTDVSVKQLRELEDLFAPFTGIIYPEDVMLTMRPDQIKSILTHEGGDPHFSREIRKREERSLSIGEDWSQAAYWEAVWVSKTIKLRNWALSQGYDSFVYKSIGEGQGDDVYVPLNDHQVQRDPCNMVFNRQAFLGLALPAINAHVRTVTRDNARGRGYSSRCYVLGWSEFSAILEPASSIRSFITENIADRQNGAAKFSVLCQIHWFVKILILLSYFLKLV